MLKIKKLKKIKTRFPVMLAEKALDPKQCEDLIKEIKNSGSFDDMIMGGRSRINKGSKNFKRYIKKSKISKKLFTTFNNPLFFKKIQSIFKKNFNFLGGRYHSLKMAEPFVSQSMIITMRCVKTNVAMAVEDDINKVYGLQFHPDSFLTPNGKYLIKKILSH